MAKLRDNVVVQRCRPASPWPAPVVPPRPPGQREAGFDSLASTSPTTGSPISRASQEYAPPANNAPTNRRRDEPDDGRHNRSSATRHSPEWGLAGYRGTERRRRNHAEDGRQGAGRLGDRGRGAAIPDLAPAGPGRHRPRGRHRDDLRDRPLERGDSAAPAAVRGRSRLDPVRDCRAAAERGDPAARCPVRHRADRRWAVHRLRRVDRPGCAQRGPERPARDQRRRLVLPQRRAQDRAPSVCPRGDLSALGTVIIQIDGLAEPVLRRAIADGQMPTLARWLTRRHASARSVGVRRAIDDEQRPGRHPARQQREHPRLPLVREGEPAAAGLQPPRGRDRSSTSGRRPTTACSATRAPVSATSSRAAPSATS